MKIFKYYIFLTILILVIVYTKSINNEDFYLVYINSKNKNTVIKDIHNLIMQNKNNYKDTAKFKSIEKEYEKNKDSIMDNYGDSGYVYPVSSIGETTILMAYLNPELITKVKSMPNVLDCKEKKPMHVSLDIKPDNYRVSSVSKTTKIVNKKTQENSQAIPTVVGNSPAVENDIMSSAQTNSLLNIKLIFALVFLLYLIM